VFTGDRATIGRGTDRTIQIPDHRIPLAHSSLSVRDNKLELKAGISQSFTLNNQTARRAELNAGDEVDILGHEFRVLPAEGDSDFLIEVEFKVSDVDPLRDRFKTRLWQLNFPIRSISWAMFALILSVSVLIPSFGFLVGMDFMREAPVPDDRQWEAGKLHDSHAFLSNNCESCHAIPFVPARDEECLSCHLSVHHHFDTKSIGVQHDYQVGSQCQDCHREHNGSQAMVRADQALCTTCHSDLAAVGLDTGKLRNTTDFLLDHPSFMASFLEMQPDETWKTQRMALWDDDLIENSNLKFPHELHMSEDGIDGPDSVVVLECASCHVSEKGGLQMKPVKMEQHCASCHQLSFDPETPDRVVPHGAPKALIEQLEGYYAYQFLQQQSLGANAQLQGSPQKFDPPGEQREARRPGKRRDRQIITEMIPIQSTGEPISLKAKAFIDQRVKEAATNLFERQTCTICHEITPQEGDVPWKILPVRITEDWMPLAEFSHDSHVNMSCVGCHDADTSTEATDVLMPDIGTCRACHGGEHSEDRLQSTCITCHNFHLDNQGPMGMLLLIDEEGNLIDTEGNFVDELGNLIDEEGNPIDSEGNLVDEMGNILEPAGLQ
jgi:predicted CXXCH cytochrome family protein